MNTVEVCIFEDVRFSIDWDIPSAFKCDAQRTRTERGWTFRLHDTYCPENDDNNPQSLVIDSEEAYSRARCFVSDELIGYGCLFFDCRFKSNGIALHLTEQQKAKLLEIGVGEIHEHAFPGLYLAMCAAKNVKWRGVIAIASTASGQKDYERFVTRLKAVTNGKRIFTLGHALTDCDDVGEFGRSCELAIEQFLQFVGARRSPKERLHPPETESWFENDVDHVIGHPPHTWTVFECLDANSSARKSLNRYLANLFGCTEAEARQWAEGTYQGMLHSQLKKTVGACARVHAAKCNIRGPTLFSLLLAASACCPNPISWLRDVRVSATADVFYHDCSAEEAKSLFDELIARNGLFLRLFVWDQEHCPDRTKDTPVIVAVQICYDLLKIILHKDFNVAKLASRNGLTKQCLDNMNEALRKGKHPLLIKLDPTDNAVVFQSGGGK